MSLDQRKEKQAQAVAREVVEGSRVESESDYQAVLVSGGKINHLLHFFVGVFTCGGWWIVWIFLTLTGGEKRYIVRTDDYGNTRVEKGKDLAKGIIAAAAGGAVLVLVFLIIISAVTDSSPTSTPTLAPTSTPTLTPTSTPTLMPTPAPASVTLSGKGQDIRVVNLTSGTYVLEMMVTDNDDCSFGSCVPSGFVVEVGSISGGYDLVANEIASARTGKEVLVIGDDVVSDGLFQVPPGDILIQVTAEGSRTVKFQGS